MQSRLIGVGLTLLVIAAVLPFVAFAVPQVIGADHGFVVLSDSMAPAINAGDAVIVNSVDPAEISKGDVITFERGNDLLVTHRVVSVSNDGGTFTYQTKGDNNEDPDPQPVQASQLVGRVMITLPFVGYVVSFAGTPLGLGVLVGVPFGLLALSELWAMYGRSETPSDTAVGQETTLADFAEETRNEYAGQDQGGVQSEPDDGSPTMVRIGPGTDVTLTISALAVLAVYSAATGIRTGFPESYAVSAFAVFAIAGLLYLTRGGDTSTGPEPSAAPDDRGGGSTSRIDPFDHGGGAGSHPTEIPEDAILDADQVKPADSDRDNDRETEPERPPTAGEPTIHGGERS